MDHLEKSLRSILVKNIPKGVTEDGIKDLLAESGSIINFRLLSNNGSQAMLCEYGSAESAVKAIQALNNYEIKGNSLQVDSAASDRGRLELERLLASITDSKDENEGNQEKAPEEISKAVASLPAEQMFELMKQMKMCIDNNAQEARTLLLQNPQLAFALLQAQVVMRIVEPEVALKILNRPVAFTTNQDPKQDDLTETMDTGDMSTLSNLSDGLLSANPFGVNSANQIITGMGDRDFRNLNMDSDLRFPPMMNADKDMRQMSGDSDLRMLVNAGGRSLDPRFRNVPDPRALNLDPRSALPSDIRLLPGQDPRMAQGQDPRMAQGQDSRMAQGQDPRMAQGQDPRTLSSLDPRVAADSRNVDPRLLQGQDSGIMPGHDPRAMLAQDPRFVGQLGSQDPRSIQDPRSATDPRLMQMLNRSNPSLEGSRQTNIDPRMAARMEDPRKNLSMGISGPANRLPAGSGIPMAPGMQISRPPAAVPQGNLLGTSEDQEKAALIMQVLQLSEEQISLLPPEQRQGILVLKEQIARSQLTM